MRENKNKTNKNLLFVGIIAILIISIFIFSKDSNNKSTGLISVSAKQVAACNDRIDNDRDRLIDYPNDPGCSSTTDDTETDSNLICDNGQDEINDADLLADYRLSGGDPGCLSAIDPSEIDGECDDKIDNDNDTKIDFGNFGDSKCDSFSDPAERPKDSCKDTDGGINQWLRGIVSGDDNDIPFSNTDFCITTRDLNEYYCGDKTQDYDPLSLVIDCSGGNATGSCSNGACT